MFLVVTLAVVLAMLLTILACLVKLTGNRDASEWEARREEAEQALYRWETNHGQ